MLLILFQRFEDKTIEIDIESNIRERMLKGMCKTLDTNQQKVNKLTRVSV
jgi:hypothetical protein